MISDLTVIYGECHGAVGFHKRNGKVFSIRSGSTVLATGGAGSIYAQTDNAPGATGDGYALALDAGLELMDMEFVQFYPLVYAGSGHAHMILPAFFADFGKITNRLGEDIKEKYDLRERPVAIVSRDRLSQALFREVSEGNGFDGTIQLDLRNVDIRGVPGGELVESSLKKKISYDTQPVRIVPACHHTMGGIVTDEYGHTELKHLYAIGEVAGGIHGANRMGGNALCEALVFGKTAVESAAANRPTGRSESTYESLVNDIVRRRFQYGETDAGKASVISVMKTLKRILWDCVGIIRSKDSLKKGIADIEGVLDRLKERKAGDPGDLKRLLECRNAVLSGRAVAVSALERKESRGSHFREEFLEEDTNWCKHIHVKMQDALPAVNRITGI
jgi:succinate dehydrogenase/fumarate reductase flavoprotein subunit